MDVIQLSAEAGDFTASATARLANVAELAFGEEWPRGLSQLTGVSLRTCQRLKAAALVETPHPSAKAVLKRLREHLSGFALMADPTDGKVHRWVSEDESLRRWVIGRVYGDIMNLDGGDRPGEDILGPYRASDLHEVMDMAGDLEYGGAALAGLIVQALNEPDPAKVRELLLEGAYEAQGLTGSFIEVASDGKLTWVTQGDPVFGDVKYGLGTAPHDPRWDLIFPMQTETEADMALKFFQRIERPARRIALLKERGQTVLAVIVMSGLDEPFAVGREWSHRLGEVGVRTSAIEPYPLVWSDEWETEDEGEA
jgi:hypothetical protein